MSIVQFSADLFLNEVMPDVPSCPSAIVVNAIRNAAIEFCQKSLVWRQELDPVNVYQGQDVYDLDGMPGGSVIERILTLYYLGRKLTPQGMDALDAKRKLAAVSKAASVSGNPTDLTYVPPVVTEYGQNSPTQVVLYGMPDGNFIGGLVMNCVLMPARTSLGIDSSVTDRYLDGIVQGAKARLMLIPKKPWSDAALAAYHKGEAHKILSNAKAEAAQGFGRAPIRVAMYR